MNDFIPDKWINTREMLPECDGLYEVTNRLNSYPQAIMKYDGYGFEFDGIYRCISYWRPMRKMEKQYGKVIKKTMWEG